MGKQATQNLLRSRQHERGWRVRQYVIEKIRDEMDIDEGGQPGEAPFSEAGG